MIASSYDYKSIYADGITLRAEKRYCPYCRRALPNCDCGYGMMITEKRPKLAPKYRLRALFALFGLHR